MNILTCLIVSLEYKPIFVDTKKLFYTADKFFIFENVWHSVKSLLLS